MAQFDVHINPNSATSRSTPYLLDVQADVLKGLKTRVVIPSVTVSAMGRAAKHLNPQFEIEGTAVVMSTAELAGVPLQALGEVVTSLKPHREKILAAVDFLLTGY